MSTRKHESPDFRVSRPRTDGFDEGHDPPTQRDIPVMHEQQVPREHQAHQQAQREHPAQQAHQQAQRDLQAQQQAQREHQAQQQAARDQNAVAQQAQRAQAPQRPQPAARAPAPQPAIAIAANETDAGRVLDEIIRQAVTGRASDIHIEPKGEKLRLRFRVDGVMVDRGNMPGALANNLLSRIKVLSKMDISEKRNPQDGVFKVDLREGAVSVRASTFPCIDGEKAVMRLARTTKVTPLEKLGMVAPQFNLVRQISSRTGGLFLVTGPTGSGKSSTLYGIIEGLDTQNRNVVTLEDPIEVPLPTITQGQVNPKAGFTFASGLRSILRQDPDVILVGEMRDEETATVAVQASLTGHLVMSTLHTNSSIDTVARLLDIGLSPYSVANALIGIVSQRLVRTLCECATTYELDNDMSAEIGFPLPVGARVKAPNGCDNCHRTGFRGRMGIYEVVEINDKLRWAIKQKAESTVFKQILREMGVPTVRRAGMRLVMHGLTTPQEVLRVT